LLLTWALGGLLVILFVPKGQVLMWLYAHRTPWADNLFRYLTFLGDGWILGGLAMLLLLFRVNDGLRMLTVLVTTGLIILILKQWVFPGWDRPVAWFSEEGIQIQPVPGSQLYRLYAFPSGHTAGAFAFFITLARLRARPWIAVAGLLIAIGVGASRIYLAQHFLQDVITGGAIGILVAIVWDYLSLQKGWFRQERLQRPLFLRKSP